MPFSDSYANQILDWAFGKGSLSNNAIVYIGLCSIDPEANGGWDRNKELSGNGYSRVMISQYGMTYPNVISNASGRAITNAYQINWTKATGNWLDVKGFGLFTAITGGDPFFYGKLEEPVPVEAGSVALFDPGNLKISFPKTDASMTVTSE